MNKNILKYKKEIERHNNRKALGYESTLDFNFGYISALLSNKLINKKEYNILWRFYATKEEDHEDYYYYINNHGDVIKEYDKSE